VNAPVDPDLLTALGDLTVEVARCGGGIALAGRRRAVGDSPASGTKSSATDLVTEYDRAAEVAMVSLLRERRPADAIVGEEGASVDGSSGAVWYLDPIDGTTNFVYNLPSWSTSVGVAVDGTMVAGAVFLPTSGELFRATLGGGAWLDTPEVPTPRRLRASDRDELALTLVATGFAYRAETRRHQATRLADLIASVRDVRRSGSAAVDLCRVACGRVDAYYEEHLNAWDMAAGELIAREAGARSSDFTGGPPRPEQLLVAAPGVHDQLVALLAAS
jgi:myo-inositol-1(or 4)-monophosphatase